MVLKEANRTVSQVCLALLLKFFQTKNMKIMVFIPQEMQGIIIVIQRITLDAVDPSRPSSTVTQYTLDRSQKESR